MKKISILLMIFLFTATTVNYAAIQKEKPDDTKAPDTGLYTDHSSAFDNSLKSSDAEGDAGSLFRSGPADGPGGRPGVGDGIGEDTPLGNELPELFICSILFAAGGFYKERRKAKKPQ